MHKAFVDTNILIRLIVKDDDIKRKAIEKLFEKANQKKIILYILPVAILEIVWVLEKFYKLDKKTIREFIEAVLNTSEIKCDMENVFRSAIKIYEEKNIKFADAVMGCWGLDKDISTVYTYDEKDFKRIPGLNVKRP